MNEEVKAIQEKYKNLREDPMTPQYLVGRSQSGTLLDDMEAEEIAAVLCRYEHKLLSDYVSPEGYKFCHACGSRVCADCGEDVGKLYKSWTLHKCA